MSEQITTLDVRAPWRRVLLLLPVVVALVVMWYVVRLCMGDTMAEWLADATTARAATQLAPSDPQAHYTLARLAEQSFEPEQLTSAVKEYEQATALSPNDYRLWFQLGNARGLVGDDAGAELALRRAVELAPNYPEPHWYLGNLLLRTGRDEQAFAELRLAAAENPKTYLPQVFDLAWHVFKGDMAAVLAATGDTPAARAGLADYLLKQQRLDDALRLWSNLNPAQQQEQYETGAKLEAALVTAKRYHGALDVERALHKQDSASLPTEGQLLNGGFESPVGPAGRSWYDWQVTPVAQAQINLDERVKHSDRRSLRIVFNAASALDFHHVAQLVVVAPQTLYRLAYFVRTEELQSSSTLLTEVVDASDETRVLAASAPLANGTSDWQPVALEFKTGAQTEAVIVRLRRPPCTLALCPLFGKVWYDDFNLQRLDARAGADGGARANDTTAHANAR
jgi:Flp pilus assembly protein TadD